MSNNSKNIESSSIEEAIKGDVELKPYGGDLFQPVKGDLVLKEGKVEFEKSETGNWLVSSLGQLLLSGK